MILLWGVPGDGPMAQVRDALVRMGYAPAFLDQRTALGARAEMSAGPDLAVTMTTAGGMVDLGGVTAAYLRPYDPRDLPAVRHAGPGSDKYQHAVLLEDLLQSWAELTQALVVNRPSAMAPNSSKPFQAAQLRQLGFCVPDTLITTDPAAVVEFRRKTPAGHLQVDQQCQEHRIRTDRRPHVAARRRVLVPDPVPGARLRHRLSGPCCGHEVFAAEIRSEAVDYRYAGRQGCGVTIRTASIADEVAQRCIAASREMGLAVSGADLRLTDDGEWYLFRDKSVPGIQFLPERDGPAHR